MNPFFSFFLCFLMLSTRNLLAQEKSIIQYKGNVFELYKQPSDTIYIENIETGEREFKVSRPDIIPISMNGLKIAQANESNSLALPDRSINEYLIDLILQNNSLFNQLNDGRYSINPRHFVVTENGELVYYKFDGIENFKLKNQKDITTKNDLVKTKINQLINDLFNSNKIKFDPATKDGQKILGMAADASVWISVANNKATVEL